MHPSLQELYLKPIFMFQIKCPISDKTGVKGTGSMKKSIDLFGKELHKNLSQIGNKLKERVAGLIYYFVHQIEVEMKGLSTKIVEEAKHLKIDPNDAKKMLERLNEIFTDEPKVRCIDECDLDTEYETDLEDDNTM